MGWTLCKKELPETYNVLCVDRYGEMLFGHPFEDEDSSTGYSAETDDGYMYDCLAWQKIYVNIPQLLEEEQKYKEATKMTNQEKFIQTFGIDAWKQMVVFSGMAEQFKEYWTSKYDDKEAKQ